ncbi:hypothetical protein BDV18DRAFT_147326 [Aspergillus unguis]
MASVRRVLTAQWATDFLQDMLEHGQDFTVLVVCASRETFLEQLIATIHLQSTSGTSHHQLLSKTLGLLSKSRNVRTVFCPTLEHLRAYLSTGIEGRLPDIQGSRQKARTLLALLNPLSLHRSTREFSAQGLSRTLANAVEISSRSNMDTVLCECRDSLDLDNTELGEALWYVDVPLLNSSLRPGTDGDVWNGRTVPVKRVVQRWFQFTELNK